MVYALPPSVEGNIAVQTNNGRGRVSPAFPHGGLIRLAASSPMSISEIDKVVRSADVTSGLKPLTF